MVDSDIAYQQKMVDSDNSYQQKMVDSEISYQNKMVDSDLSYQQKMVNSENSYQNKMVDSEVNCVILSLTGDRAFSEESCVYCSKGLMGLNDFNRKMHINTCKVRKLVDANRTTDDTLEYIPIGENCSYCFKSFKDFKSDFNKRIHIKCCKIKKETYDQKNNLKMNLGGEHCVFCTKPLANLNEFNKRMHIENCKIRKSIESSGPNANKNKEDSIIKYGIELGDSCLHCNKPFVNLSDFNKRLHFEYCKLKKKKMRLDGSLMSSSMNMSSNSLNTSGGMSSAVVVNGNLVQATSSSMSMKEDSNKIDLGEICLFCSRSLLNLSTFNKRIHIETCKIKTLKKAAKAQLRQTQSAKGPRKRSKKDNNNNISLQLKPNQSMVSQNNSFAT